VTHSGVGAFSCDYATFEQGALTTASLENVVDGVFTGCKFQCVELARRYLLVNKGVVFGGVDNAFEIMDLHSVRRVSDDTELPLRTVSNGATAPPPVGSLLIWEAGDFVGSAGHVAVVVGVSLEAGKGGEAAGYVDVVEQNWVDTAWPAGQSYSRRLPLALVPRDSGEMSFFVQDHTAPGIVVLGWAVVDDAANAVAARDGHSAEDGL
jgi:glutathionylspermidine amidase/synthetase